VPLHCDGNTRFFDVPDAPNSPDVWTLLLRIEDEDGDGKKKSNDVLFKVSGVLSSPPVKGLLQQLGEAEEAIRNSLFPREEAAFWLNQDSELPKYLT